MVTQGRKSWSLASIACATWTFLVILSQNPWTTTTSAARGFQIPLPRSASKVWNHPRTFRKAVLERGGDTPLTASTDLPSYKAYIEGFLASKGSKTSLLKNFYIQGWRWHTKSLFRDAGRLHKLATKTDLVGVETLRDASDFVVGFNLIGLHKIEASLFFPWMREKLTSQKDLQGAFSAAMDDLESDRRTVASLGEQISNSVRVACNPQLPEDRRTSAITKVANQSLELQAVTQKMMALEDQLLVPAIGAIVPPKEQKSFNNRVLLKLGILDSRLHLVGMYEAVWEDGDSNEKELFEEAIPALSRKMIPRWKQKLYEPKTNMLE